ncbi:alpha/beta hydrolase [Saccharothrix violaceirubra]|uniref:Acyl-CoA:diacylglycerol acyltransferase n=1 Tax=Saccharothrix violaceirubra TaxID=413306 RepID=A0A7W7T7E4_9PSEU|nr:alpha/beta hydrolase-fold protein [Saccharothrix violaceirubra]MBB4967957.1 S-formylglutathione hydrolase FrmB [Saccharothrix violaceirubra]
MISRRTVLTTVGAGGLTAAAVLAAGPMPALDALWSVLGVAGPVPTPKRAVVKVDRVYSRYRGREVDLQTIVPPGVSARGLPMSILLHGLHGSARLAAVANLPEALVTATTRGIVPPFGFVSVDGGDNYWHENVPGDDPMAMLLEEVPVWLAERGFGPVFACTGVSMGGFGALLYGRRERERRESLGAIAAVSPGLITTWEEMAKRKAFADREQWVSLDPLRNLDKVGDAPTGIWIGDRDKFIEGTRRFIEAVKPVVGSITPGRHDDAFYRTITDDVVRFLGKRVPKRS